jgi:formamidopyrimidine-DNA glycosylase
MLISPNSKNGNTLLNKALMAMRIVAGIGNPYDNIVLLVGIKLQSKLRTEVEN